MPFGYHLDAALMCASVLRQEEEAGEEGNGPFRRAALSTYELSKQHS